MIKKYYYLLITIITLYLIFCPFIGIEAKNSEEQPEVCAGPSETMAMYFQFQNEMMSAMLGSEINERRFVTTKTDGGLFKEKFLTLGTGKNINALDIIATNVRGNMQAAGSSITTLTVLLALAEASVLQSNTEGLRILTKDRVIVREYKQLLDIESSLMELAYFLSKRISLISKFEGSLIGNITTVIKKYQELGLLEKTSNLDSLSGSTIADIMTEMVMMNAYMKHFVLFNAGLGDFEPSIIPDFSESAIRQLRKDYGGLGVFGACNQYASNFKNTISKGVKNNKDAVENAMEDVSLATKRLMNVFSPDGDGGLKRSNRCNMSEYEMSQLRAYRGGNRSCKTSLVNGTAISSVQNSITDIQEFIKEKKAQRAQKEKTTKLSKDERKALKYQKKVEKLETQIEKLETKVYNDKNKNKKQTKKAEKEAKQKELLDKIDQMLEEKKIGKDAADKMMKIIQEGAERRENQVYLMQLQEKIAEAKDMNNKTSVWRDLYGTGVLFSISYSGGFNSSLVEMYSGLMDNYKQSHENAISSDLSYELVNIRAILDQVDDTSTKMDDLKSTLKDIAKYQCGN